MLKRMAITGLCLVAASLVGPAAVAGDQGGSCGGKLIDYIPFYSGAQKIGQLQLYYNAGNGNNCAILYHGGPTWGVRSYTGISLYSRTQLLTSNSGNFQYQAGPIRVPGRGRCISAAGGIQYKGSYISAGTGNHCG